TVVAPKLIPTLDVQAKGGTIRHQQACFTPEHLRGMVLAIAATNSIEVNRQVAHAAEQLQIPVNVVDTPSLCSFIMPSIIDRSPVVLAVSTGGASPMLARLIRGRLEATIPAAYGRLAALVTGFRAAVKARFPRSDQRREFWEKILQGPLPEMVFAGQDKAA